LGIADHLGLGRIDGHRHLVFGRLEDRCQDSVASLTVINLHDVATSQETTLDETIDFRRQLFREAPISSHSIELIPKCIENSM